MPTPTDGGAALAWAPTAVDESTVAPILGFEATVDGTGAVHATGAAATSLLVDGLANGVATTITLRARNAVGCSPPLVMTVVPSGAHSPHAMRCGRA